MTPLLLGDAVALLRPLWLPLALGLGVLAFAWRAPPRTSGWRGVLSDGVLAYLGGDERNGTPARRTRPDPLLLAAALVALALAAPATRRGADDAWRQSTGWIVLADVSRSMTLDDVVPSRLAALRATSLALSERAGARPLALIVYAGDAFLVAPAAFDRRLVEEQVALLEHGIVPLEGSNLARALSLAASVASDSAFARARVIVLGDSGGTTEASVAAARHLASLGHRVDVVSFGREENGEAGDVATTIAGTGNAGREENDIGEANRPPSGDLTDRADVPSERARLAVDVVASERLAGAGGGRLVRSDAFGAVPLDALELGRGDDPESVAALERLLWQDRSHWLLLGVAPLLLGAFRRGVD